MDNGRKKNILLGVLVVGVISMTVAFAALSTNLRINGTANVAATRWNIHFDNWTMAKPNTNVAGVTNTATQTQAAALSQSTNTTLINGLEVNLAQPGDTMSYTFDVVNDGTIDAKLDNFDAGITSASSTSDLEYTVVCGEQATKGSQVLGNTPSTPEATDELDAGKARACKLTITYKEATNVHTAGQNQVYSNPTARSITMHASWTWLQADTSSAQSGGNSGSNTPVGGYAYLFPNHGIDPQEDEWPTELNSELKYYLIKNTSTENIDLCGVFSSGTVCMTSSYYNSEYSTAGNYESDFEGCEDSEYYEAGDSANNTCLKGYAKSKLIEMLSKGATSCEVWSSSMRCYGVENNNGPIWCDISDSGSVGCQDEGDTCSIYEGEGSC